ncbi:DUF6252 family protein [Flavobacterium filum]|uniref:DUF6252 family protein n=1 Tax=Flavobacterium TaxID=237 RepID=UPI0004289871|nr:DUF6252 family protein [Flavobacterium filum]
MKILKFILIFVLAGLTSCSSDSSGGSSVSNALTVNGTTVTLGTVIAQKSEESLFIYASASDGSSIQIGFNKYGNLESVIYDDQNFNSFYNYQYFKSNYFDFDLISINESNNSVKISYSGTLYSNENDLESNSISISGSFNVNYINQTPLIEGLGLSCKIGGQNWYETDFWDNGFSNVDRKFISDDDKMIIMNFEDESIEPGTYTFNGSNVNKLSLAKFNTTTKEYDSYNTSGTVTITSNTIVSGVVRVIEGTFSFTATNGSNTIEVTNGTFKTNF